MWERDENLDKIDEVMAPAHSYTTKMKFSWSQLSIIFLSDFYFEIFKI